MHCVFIVCGFLTSDECSSRLKSYFNSYNYTCILFLETASISISICMDGFAFNEYILCKCTLSHCVPHLPPTHPHTHTHTLDVPESFLQSGCVQLVLAQAGQELCHDSQQVPIGSSTIGPVPWVQWREMTLHTLTGTTEQCYSRTAMSACIHVHTSLS